MKSAWGRIDSWEGEDSYLYYTGPADGQFELRADWEAVSVDLGAEMFALDTEMAKEKLDAMCRLMGREPAEAPQWHICPLYS